METIAVHPTPRPALLTVLCVLTFIGSGIGLFSNIMGMFMAPFLDMIEPHIFEDALREIQNTPHEAFMKELLDIVMRAFDNAFSISLYKSILFSTSLTGAILMFRMKKVGFYIYCLAQLALMFASPIFIGWNIISSISIFTSGFFVILFIALYAVNVKHLD